MTYREIGQQHEHWAICPPPAVALLRIGCALGLPAPEPRRGGAAPVQPSSLEELRAMGASLGIGGTPPWEIQ